MRIPLVLFVRTRAPTLRSIPAPFTGGATSAVVVVDIHPPNAAATKAAEATKANVKRHLAMQGIYGGGKKPFGFDIVDGRLVPNESEQAAIARMRELRTAGAPFRDISHTIAARSFGKQ